MLSKLLAVFFTINCLCLYADAEEHHHGHRHHSNYNQRSVRPQGFYDQKHHHHSFGHDFGPKPNHRSHFNDTRSYFGPTLPRYVQPAPSYFPPRQPMRSPYQLYLGNGPFLIYQGNHIGIIIR